MKHNKMDIPNFEYKINQMLGLETVLKLSDYQEDCVNNLRNEIKITLKKYLKKLK